MSPAPEPAPIRVPEPMDAPNNEQPDRAVEAAAPAEEARAPRPKRGKGAERAGSAAGSPKRSRKKKGVPKTAGKKKSRRRVDLEVEVKLRCESLDCLSAAGLRVEQVEPRHFEDNWVFKLPDGKLRKGQYLRVRYRGDGNGSGARREGVLTYKGKSKRTGDSQKGRDRGKKVREEIETTVGQPNKMVKILKRLGLKRSFRYQKYRSVHRAILDDGTSLLVMFDETPIGNFLELEGDAEQIERVASLIGFRPSDFVAESYVEMQLSRCIEKGEPLRDMVFAPTEASARPKRKSKG